MEKELMTKMQNITGSIEKEACLMLLVAVCCKRLTKIKSLLFFCMVNEDSNCNLVCVYILYI